MPDSATALGSSDPAALRRLEDRVSELEAALAASEARYDLVMTGPNEGIWEWNPNTKALKLSARLLSILGFAGGTLHTTSHEWLALVHPNDRPHYEATLIEHLKGRTPHFECQYRVCGHDGTYRWCLARGIARFDDQGRAVHMVGSIGDITLLHEAQTALERRVAERTAALQAEITAREATQRALETAKQQAETASQAKSSFLANMSHELRTPLNAIIGFSEMMALQTLGPLGQSRYVDYARIIHESGGHLLAVINDILDLAKIEAGKLDLHLEPVDLAACATACERLLRAKADEAGVHLTLETAPGLPLLLADPLRLKQILLNLLSNALKFTPSGGHVTVSMNATAGAGITLRVRDTGIGMDEAGMRVALEPFGQATCPPHLSHAGTGLGLPLSRQLVELLGGALILSSTVGHGTIVTLTFPSACTRPAAPERQAAK